DHGAGASRCSHSATTLCRHVRVAAAGSAARTRREAQAAELRETDAVAALDVVRLGAFAGLYLTHLDTTDARARVAREAIPLAELAIVDDVNADLNLLADDLLDRGGEGGFELGGLGIASLHELPQLR